MNSRLMISESEISAENGFVFFERHIPAGTEYAIHWHNFFEFEIITSGKGLHTYNGTAYEASKGSAYLMSYYDFHSLKALDDMVLYSIHFDENLLDTELSQILAASANRFRCSFEGSLYEKITKQMIQLEKEADTVLPCRSMMIKNIISEIVIEMIRKSTDVNALPSPIPVQRAIAYINARFRTHITLEMLAKELSFSPNYLGQLFKRQTGLTFNDSLNTTRLKYACNLLSVSDMSVKEIAHESGYATVEYFLYSFKKKMGLSPQKYRSIIRSAVIENSKKLYDKDYLS